MQLLLGAVVALFWNELHAMAERLSRRCALEAGDLLDEAVLRALRAQTYARRLP
jgi:DNA-directed RNA polymerase specialized sigma24 family protein